MRTGVSRAGRIESIVATLQEAAFDEDRWAVASALIDDAARVLGSHLSVLRREWPSEFLFSRILFHGEPLDEVERMYVQDYGSRDERGPRLRALPYGCLVHNTALFTEREMKTSPLYCGFLPRVGSNNQALVRLEGVHDTDIYWCLTAPTGSDWGSEEIAVIERLLPHVRHFVRVRQALTSADAREASLTGLLDRSGLAVLHLDRTGRVLEANALARELLVTRDLILQRDRQLRARAPNSDTRLGRLLSICCRKGVGGSMTLHPHSGTADSEPLLLCACPVAPDHTTFDSRGVSVQVLLTRLGSTRSVDTRHLTELYDLTPAESRVAGLLAEGRAVSEIAASTGRKESTVRWHVRNLHSKLGVHRQMDLVRLVLSAAAAAPAE
ncbi:MAG: helix-turn-helix transcriptional regulator [Acidobacteria bacterium]|nr:helix-turn-helix transcriptional regulator [Acidobacteriota bacterium]